MLWGCGSILDPEYMKIISLVALDAVPVVCHRPDKNPAYKMVGTWPCSGFRIDLALYPELAPIETTSSRNWR